MKALEAAIERAAQDPERPVYHFRPPARWMNDPNGTLYYRGWHHLFYQLNPIGAEWNHMHWGHARSRDLVNWEHLPIALWPSRDKGEDHCFSGGAVLGPDGRPRLFYTSIGRRDPEQWMAIPEDEELVRWRKYEHNPVLTLAVHGGVRVAEWRDPFLFTAGGTTYMVCGGNLRGRGGAAAVQLYEAAGAELTRWRYRGVVFEYRNQDVYNFECPNLFPLDGRWVLLVSPHRPCEYFVGSLDLRRARFEPFAQGTLDAGDAYASNVSRDAGGRVILWLWGRTRTDPKKGWNGVMVLPRILRIGEDGYLRQRPAEEFTQLRGQEVRFGPATLGAAPLALSPRLAGDTLDVEARFELGTARRVGLRLRCPSGGGRAGSGVAVTYDTGGFLSAGATRVFLGRDARLALRVLLDKRVMEVYANGGERALFSAIDARPEDTAMEAFAEGGQARLLELTGWPMRPARFSFERFRA
jgi:beta-fructofuranosidase